MMTRIRDLRLLAQAGIDLLRVDRALRRDGFSRLLAQIDSIDAKPASAVRRRDIRLGRRYARRIAEAGRFSLPRVQCLHRSLVLHAWLRREGLPSELKIGVVHDGEILSAHAWIELAGDVINDQRKWVDTFTSLSGRRLNAATALNQVQSHDGQPEQQTSLAAQMGNRA